MTKFNSTTAILSDLDGVILDLNYDMKFWQDWLPDALALSSGKTRSEIKAELVAMMKNQEASLNWYDLNYWDEYFKVDCLEIIKAQEERCSFLDGSVDALNKFAALPNPKYILTNGDAGVGQVYWINKGRSKVLSNGVITYPTLAELVSAIL